MYGTQRHDEDGDGGIKIGDVAPRVEDMERNFRNEHGVPVGDEGHEQQRQASQKMVTTFIATPCHAKHQGKQQHQQGVEGVSLTGLQHKRTVLMEEQRVGIPYHQRHKSSHQGEQCHKHGGRLLLQRQGKPCGEKENEKEN